MNYSSSLALGQGCQIPILLFALRALFFVFESNMNDLSTPNNISALYFKLIKVPQELN
jgi:hypothetical protein